MAIQDRIIVYKSGKEEIYYLNNLKPDEIVFEFKEFEKVEIELVCNESGYIEFEYPSDDKLKKIYNGEHIILNDFEYERDSSENNIFYPSQYYMSVYSNNEKIDCYFYVKSNALGDKIEDIRKIVHDFSSGLELDLFNKKKSKTGFDSNSSYYITLYDKIISASKMLHFELDYIIKHPIENLEKKVEYTRKYTKESKKKAQYEIKKEITLNSGKKSVQVKTKVSCDNFENNLLVTSTKKIIKTCDSIWNDFEIAIKKINEQLLIGVKELETIEKKRKDLNVNRHDKKYQSVVLSEYKQIKERNDKYKSRIIDLKNRQKFIKKIRNDLLSLILDSWMNELTEFNHFYGYNKILKNIHYKKIIDFSKNIDADFNLQYQKKGSYSYKKTSKLYEIYVLVLLFKIFENCGYDLDLNDDYDLNLLFESQEYVFVNGSKRIRLIYDQTIKGTDENPIDELSNQNSTSNRPDIVIMVYDNFEIINCIIIEVKCRRKNNIYVRTGDTPVFSQLKDYTNFWYFDSNGNLNKNIIKRVYAVFPQKEICKEYLNANQICLLSLNPVYKFEDDESYLNLCSEIKKYI